MQKSFVRTGDVNVKQRTVCNAKQHDVQQIYFNCQAFIFNYFCKKENINVYWLIRLATFHLTNFLTVVVVWSGSVCCPHI